MLSVGDKAPLFHLKDQNNSLISLSDFNGKWLLIYFYPRAMTPGCTTQACGLRDDAPWRAASNLCVVGISPDEPEALKKFEIKESLNFPLLSDPEHLVASLYGAWGEKTLYGKRVFGITRKSFLISPNGNISYIIQRADPKTHVDKIHHIMEISRETI